MFSPQHDFSIVFPVGNRVLSPQSLEFALILTEDETSTHILFTQHKAFFQRWCQLLFFITQLQDHTESFLFNFPSYIGIIPTARALQVKESACRPWRPMLIRTVSMHVGSNARPGEESRHWELQMACVG